MIVTYENADGEAVKHSCDQTHHHEDSQPFFICLTVDDGEVEEKLKIHEDRIVTVKRW